MTEQELKADIKAKNFKRLYLIYGEDSYLKHYYTSQIVEKSVGDMLPDMNISRLDGKTLKPQQLLDETDRLPVMAQYRCVVADDYDIAAKGENELADIKQILSELPDTTVLVLLMDTVEILPKKPGKWRSVLTLADKVGATVNFGYKTEAALQKILIDSAAKRKANLDLSTAKYLISMCGRDLQRLQSELEKLCAYKKGSYIRAEDVDLLSSKTLDASKYQLPKAILAENVSGSLKTVGELLDMRMDPIEIMGTLIGGFVDIYIAKAAIGAGKDVKSVAADFGYKGREFALANAAPIAKRMSVSTLRECLEVLNLADEKLKSTSADSRFILEQTILILIELIRGRRVNISFK